mgnify:FL=1
MSSEGAKERQPRSRKFQHVASEAELQRSIDQMRAQRDSVLQQIGDSPAALENFHALYDRLITHEKLRLKSNLSARKGYERRVLREGGKYNPHGNHDLIDIERIDALYRN